MISKWINIILNRKNKIITKLVMLHDNYNRVITIIFPIVIILLAGWLTKIILDPIKFENEKEYKYSFIKQRLIDIRSAELAFKEKNNQFTDDFDQLINFVKTDSFVIVQKTDTLIEYYNSVYRENQFKDTLIIDTLGKVSVLDSIFSKKYAIDSLAYVPFGNGIKFHLSSGSINKSKIDVPVFEASDPKPFDPIDPLKIGSMTEAHLNGNWQ
ncbi:MAG: hypothetical protein CMP65_00455 [Flavobacteriales bacterium]|nr:hypothetical protein [Flavobacteriales bacterium]